MEFIIECMAIAAKGMLGGFFMSIGLVFVSLLYFVIVITIKETWIRIRR